MVDNTPSIQFNTKELSEFRLFGDPDLDLSELLEENLGDEMLSPSEITRIKVPTGGGKSFEIPTVFGEEATKEIEAIILKVVPMRMYWKQSFEDAGNEPPDCMSNDMIEGVGDPGGKCAQCPMNQFGSDEKTGGKLCKEKRNIFILPPQATLPYNLSCPVKSIGNLKKYMQDLTREGYGINRVTTRITLEQDKNNAGIQYSKLTFQVGKPLTSEQVNVVRQYKKAFDGVFERAAQQAPGPEGPSFDE